ncbi:MAG: citrate/2-methylcitrate synthase [Polyangiaceae bacterium]
MTGREAASLLGIKAQTLYAYASRGLLRSVPSGEGRARLYARSDLERLKARHDARSGHGPVAASALRWGEPVLETSVSTIDERGPVYRGVPVIDLVRADVSFEDTAALLWGEATPEDVLAGASHRSAREPDGRRASRETAWPSPSPGVPFAKLAALLPEEVGPLSALAVAVPAVGARDAERFLVASSGETALARGLIRRMAALVCLAGDRDRFASALAETTVARSVLVAFGARATPANVRAVDRALVLSADHELNPSTFAVRVAASARADLYACVSAGLGVLSGPEHGGVCDRVEALLAEAMRAPRPGDVVAQRARRGEPIPGFGHTLYKKGDPRATPLLDAAAAAAPHDEKLAAIRALMKAMSAAGHEPPTIDMGLVAVASAVGLPPGASAALFAIGRTAGWVAHAIEQRAAGFIVRPRARYVAK